MLSRPGKSRVLGVLIAAVSVPVVAVTGSWFVVSAAHASDGGARAPWGAVVEVPGDDGSSYRLAGDAGGSVATFRNDGSFPMRVRLSDYTVPPGFMVHAGPSPTRDGYVLPGGADSTLSPDEVQAPFREFVLEPGAIAWVSVAAWAPASCRGVRPDTPVEDLSALSSGPTVELLGTVLGRSSMFSVPIAPLDVTVDPAAWPPASACGSFVP